MLLLLLTPQIWLENILDWINRLGSTAAITFILLYVVTTVLLIPGTILTLGAGVLFGLWFGSLYVLIGATLGGTAAFLVGRYFVRDWVAQKVARNPKFQAIDHAVGKSGFKIVLLTRLSPLFPFILLNYAYSLTQVSLKDYIFGSVGMIPGTMTYVYLGSLAGNLANLNTNPNSANPLVLWFLRIVGFMATVAVSWYGAKIARQTLNQTLQREEQ